MEGSTTRSDLDYPKVFKARSTLIIPMAPRRHGPQEGPLDLYRQDYKRSLLAHQHRPHPRLSGDRVRPDKPVAVWSEVNLRVSPIQEVNELTPALRDFLRGFGEEEMRLRCLTLSKAMRALTFERLELEEASGERIALAISSVKLYIYPLNTMILTIDVDWGGVERAETLLSALDMCRHLSREEERGWVITPRSRRARDSSKRGVVEPERDHPDRKLWDTLVSAYREQLGESLCSALYSAFRRREGGAVSMSALLELILKPIYHTVAPQSERYAQHHTSLVLEAEPNDERLAELLFRLRRGYSRAYIPPRRPAQEFSDYKRERAFEVRGNRWFTIAREGTGSLSWLTPETGVFEQEWPDRWAGIYCLLALQATSELATLSRLELAAASVVEQLNQEREQRAQGALFTRQLREDVQDLTFLMARYSITTSADESGGGTDYADFLSNLRVVVRTPALRSGLRQDLQEVLGLVELMHNEQEMKIERDISRFGLWITPVLIATAYFGMNNDDLPKSISHQWVFWCIILCSVGWLITRRFSSKRS